MRVLTTEMSANKKPANSDDEETGENQEDEIDTFECPECKRSITLDMDVCPNCGVGLSFEIEGVEE